MIKNDCISVINYYTLDEFYGLSIGLELLKKA